MSNVQSYSIKFRNKIIFSLSRVYLQFVKHFLNINDDGHWFQFNALHQANSNNYFVHCIMQKENKTKTKQFCCKIIRGLTLYTRTKSILFCKSRYMISQKDSKIPKITFSSLTHSHLQLAFDQSLIDFICPLCVIDIRSTFILLVHLIIHFNSSKACVECILFEVCSIYSLFIHV